MTTSDPDLAKLQTSQADAAVVLISQVAEIKRVAHDTFPDNGARLEQLDSHLATVEMVISHMADEAGRTTT